MNNKVTITISTEERKAELSFDQKGDIHSYLEEVATLLVAWGFHPDSIREGICALADQYMKKK